MKLIKEYDIPEDGDCCKCKFWILALGGRTYCIPFKKFIGNNKSQRKSCKDWLKQQKEKLKCVTSIQKE